MTRWLLVKVLDESIFDSQYKLNQLAGVDCMEVPEGQLNLALITAFKVVDPMEEQSE